MNSLTIAGHLGNDAEVRHTKTGTVITSFSVPVEQGWGDNKKTTWVRCTLFGKKGTGEEHGLTKYLMKGRFVVVTGELVLEEWESEGEKKSMVKCICRDVSLGPDAGASAKAKPSEPAGSTKEGTSKSAQNAQDEGDWRDSDVPF